ncbi:MAG TPA: hypothetical protein DDW54_04360, partial [Clostridiales bacterium]|nr:hypothetical protein [Clostridiales bacterium]
MNDEIFNDDYYSGDYDSYEYKLEQLKKKLTENKPPKKTDTMKKSKRDEDNEDDYDEDGEKVREHPVTRGDEEEYAQNKKKWKVMHDTELLLKKLRHKLALTGNFETFSEMLFRLIGEKKIKPSDCYKRANVDRRLFYKIKHKKYYAPTK